MLWHIILINLIIKWGGGKNNKGFKLYSVIRDKYIDYVIWDKKSYNIFMIEAWTNYAQWQHEKKENSEKIIYVVRAKKDEKNTNLEQTQNKDFKKIFSSTSALDSTEGYNIYIYTGSN